LPSRAAITSSSTPPNQDEWPFPIPKRICLLGQSKPSWNRPACPT